MGELASHPLSHRGSRRRPGDYDSPLEHLPPDTDVALLQETQPSDEAPRIEHGPGPTAILAVSSRAAVQPIQLDSIPIAAADGRAHPTSYPGTISMSLVTNLDTDAQLYLVSIYVKWEKTGSWIVSDASAHRLVSDVSSLIKTERHKVPIVVAGDWNLFFQHGETAYWFGRYDSVFRRMQALGFDLIGPFASDGGLHRNAPEREWMQPPETSTPTYYTTRETSAVAWRQLDFVFASRSIASGVTAVALNREDEWGPSDHCRIMIDVSL